jgi:DHA1 family inner membrane transport protein
MAIGAFSIGVGEFAILGLLPDVAADLDVSIPTAGYLISAYAIGVVIGAPTLMAVSTRLSRKRVMILLMGVYLVTNLMTAVAPDYGWLLAARVLAGLPHGAFMGVAAIAAFSLVEPRYRTRAMTQVFAGLTLANIAGVPLSTFIGQAFGWRPIFLIVAVLAGVCALLVQLSYPYQAAPAIRVRVGAELRSLARAPVVLGLLTTTFGAASLFATYSYIAPMVTEVAGYPEAAVPILLAIFGVGMTVGNFVGGQLVARAVMPFMYLFLVIGMLSAVGLYFALQNPVAAVVALLIFSSSEFALVAALQTRVIDSAGDAPNISSGANIAAFNVSNALGAWLGGLVIAAGFGYASPNLVAAGLAFLGLVVAIISGRVYGMGRAPAGTETPVPVTPTAT